MKAIITSDWHLRATRPRCRVDEDWIKTQEQAIEQIYKIALEKESSVFVVGDLFNTNSDASFECISLVQNLATKLEEVGLSLFILAGNHDLPFHNSENINKSAIGVLMNSNNIGEIRVLGEGISGANFDEEDDKDAELVFKHVLVFPDIKSIPPNVNAITAKELLSEFPKAKFIFTGDYHKHFHYEKDGRHVVNPGCLLRQASDMKDYNCGCYYVDTDSGEVEFVEIKDNDDFIDDSYIIREQEKEERIEKFASKLSETESISLDYLENVRNSMMTNNLNEELKDVIEELLEV